MAGYTLRRLAQELAARGVLTLRFDYDGTGDSAGGDDDSGRVGAWQKSIEEAVSLARRCGAPSVVLVGMRGGALLAAAAARATGATGFVAWDPCPSGRSFVREQHALQQLQFGDSATPAGDIELPGFVLSAETALDLGRLEPDVRGSGVRRALVLTRPGEAVPTPLSEALSGCAVDQDQAVGQDHLLEGDSQRQRIPLGAIERIATWVTELLAAAPFPVRIGLPPPATVGVLEGGELVERTVRMGACALFGIETTNATGCTGPTVIFVNSGFGSHVGPSRLWALLARRWAAAGLRCIRLDLSGMGDSPSRDGRPEHEVYAPAAFDDLSDAAHALCPDDPSNVVFVGLCSGGYQALESAVALKVRGVCAVNPILRFRPPELEDGPLDPRRRLCRPTTNVSRVARRLPDLALLSGTRLQTWREVGFGGPHKSQASWVDELVESGVDTLCLCGKDEARAVAIEMGAPSHYQGLEIHELPELDHALLPAGQRAEIVERLTDHVLSRFGPPID